MHVWLLVFPPHFSWTHSVVMTAVLWLIWRHSNQSVYTINMNVVPEVAHCCRLQRICGDLIPEEVLPVYRPDQWCTSCSYSSRWFFEKRGNNVFMTTHIQKWTHHGRLSNCTLLTRKHTHTKMLWSGLGIHFLWQSELLGNYARF